MPYTIEKLENGKYRVSNATTGKVFSSGTTRSRAESQVKYLHLVANVQRANGNPNYW